MTAELSVQDEFEVIMNTEQIPSCQRDAFICNQKQKQGIFG